MAVQNSEETTGKKDEILYITDNLDLNKVNNIKIISPAEANDISYSDVLWVDGHVLKNSDVKDKIEQTFKNGARIIILDSEAELSDIYEIFDTDQAEFIRATEKNSQEEMITEYQQEISSLKKIGFLVINEKGYKHVITLNAENNDLIFEVCKSASKYDYLSLITGTES